MKRALWIALIAFGVGAPAAGDAKPKKARASSEVRKQEERPPRPDDKSVNEGGHGRINATDDAARQSIAPQWERRP
jgi:hypothetical protein